MSEEATEEQPYPEHVKLKAISDESQMIYNFIEWLEEQGLGIAYRHTDEQLYWLNKGNQQLLAEYFKIDLNKIETEKRAMIDECRKLNEAGSNE